MNGKRKSGPAIFMYIVITITLIASIIFFRLVLQRYIKKRSSPVDRYSFIYDNVSSVAENTYGKCYKIV